jgi:hypothetical protein
MFGFAELCVEEQSVRPQEDGSYLHVEPPADINDQEDSFAELMMYHHVNGVHDYFRDTHGYDGLDFPLDAIVNVSFKAQGEWQSFPNAAFMPERTMDAFGMPSREFGAIMFGQGDGIDFSYDASVIFHEYTHAMVGISRLHGEFTDEQGLNNTPGAINEAVADYFAATILNAPLIGPYALGEYGRDLAEPRRCPEDLTTEIHADGKIVGSALWSVREAVGADVADAAAFAAVQLSSISTGFEEFGALVLAEATRISPDKAGAVEQILDDHGLLGCERVQTWRDVNLVATTGLPHAVGGTQQTPGIFPDGVPAYLQLEVKPSDARYIQLEWTLQDGGGGPWGQPAAPISLALRSGQAIEIDDGGRIVADQIVATEFAGGTSQRVVVDAACAAGGLFTQFVNTGGAGASVVVLGLDELEEAPAGSEVVSCE